MKKLITWFLVLVCILTMSGCQKTYSGVDELVEKAREELPVAEADTIELQYAGMCARGDEALIWFVSGNEYQAHYYLPLSFKIVDRDTYTFEHTHKPVDRGTDIVVLPEWNNGYAFCVNNPKCTTIKIDDIMGVHEIEVKEYPFVYFNSLLPREYVFLDKDGNEIN